MTSPLIELERHLADVSVSEAYAINQNYLTEFSSSVRVAIGVIYFYLNVLLYGRYATEDERLQTEEQLKKVYTISNVKFKSSPEYLFFAGYLSGISYWLFGEDSIEPSKKKISFAIQLNPSNLVYRWALALMTNDVGHSKIAREIVENHDVLHQLKSFGSAGRYIVEIIDEDKEVL